MHLTVVIGSRGLICDVLYHYTDRLSGAEIRRDRLLRATPTILHRDLLGLDKGFTTDPIVWLTINPILDLTVAAKMKLAGWPDALLNDIWRFVVPQDYAPLGLAEYADAHAIDAEWFRWMVRTGELAGSSYTTWRLYPKDIPEHDWLGIEVLVGNDSAGELIWVSV